MTAAALSRSQMTGHWYLLHFGFSYLTLYVKSLLNVLQQYARVCEIIFVRESDPQRHRRMETFSVPSEVGLETKHAAPALSDSAWPSPEMDAFPEALLHPCS